MYKSDRCFYYFTQEIEVVLKESREDHVLKDQTPVKMEPTLSYDNESCTLDLTSSSDNIAKVRELYVFSSFLFAAYY